MLQIPGFTYVNNSALRIQHPVYTRALCQVAQELFRLEVTGHINRS